MVNFFDLLAEEVQHMGRLGFRRLDDLIGRADLLQVNRDALHCKSARLDLAPLLVDTRTLNDAADHTHKTHTLLIQSLNIW